MLHALYPGRIDLGLGRAPGGTPLESFALRRERLDTPQPDDFGDQLVELLGFLHKGFAPRHPFNRIKLSPDAEGAPDVWLLGSSMWSSSAAAQLGLPYAFAHFIAPEPTRTAIERYRAEFKPSAYLDKPRAMMAMGVICAETDAEAERLASSWRLMRVRLFRGDLRQIPSVEEALAELATLGTLPPETSEFPRAFVGSPDTVRQQVLALGEAMQLDELMIVTITHDHKARLRSYELLADAFSLDAAPL
jgi:luciferase family oxidoreductase group 1